MGMDNQENIILASASYDHTIRFWQCSSGLCARTVQHSDSQVNALQITPDRKLLAAAGYQHVRMYDLVSTNPSNPSPVANFEGVSKNVTAVGFCRDGRWMYTGGEDNSARIWDLRSRSLQCQRIFQVGSAVNCVCLHPNQAELFVGDQSGTIYVWDLRNDHNEQFLPEPSMSIQHIDVDPDGTMLAAINNKGVCYIWNLLSPSAQSAIIQMSMAVPEHGVPDAPSLAMGEAGALTNGTNTKLMPKMKLAAHSKYGLKCKFSPDSTLLATTSGGDQSSRIFRTTDFSQMIELKVDNQRWVWDCAFTADSQYLFTCSSDHIVRLWQVENGEIAREYQGHQKAVTALAFCDAVV